MHHKSPDLTKDLIILPNFLIMCASQVLKVVFSFIYIDVVLSVVAKDLLQQGTSLLVCGQLLNCLTRFGDILKGENLSGIHYQILAQSYA